MLKSTLARLRQARASELEEAEASEAGFTLIELMVVLLIIAILLAIAIPTFLGVSGSANDRASQSNLTNALTEVKALYQNNQSYNQSAGTLPQATLAASAPEFSWQQAGACQASNGVNCISEYPIDIATGADAQGVIIASLSKTGVCWYAVDLQAAPVSAANFNGGNADAGAGFTVQFLSAVAGANAQEVAGPVAMTQAGVYYSKNTTTSCDARSPTTAGPWVWGTSYANAPVK